MNTRFTSFLIASLLIKIATITTAQADLHNPALSGGTLLLLKDPANTSPPVTLNIDWPNGSAPSSGTLTVAVDSASTGKVELIGGSSTSTLSWDSPPYPTSIQVRAKGVSSAMNDVKINVNHDNSPVSSTQLTAVKVETTTLKNITVSTPTTPVRYYPGPSPIADARIGLDNTAAFGVGLRVRPSQAVNSVTPALIQFGTGDEARYYRSPPQNVTKSVSSASPAHFDGELTEQNGGWSKNSSLGVWVTTASAEDTVELVGFCATWARMTRSNSFTVYVQYSIDGGNSWHGALSGGWEFSGDGSAGTFKNGQYPSSGPGSTIVVSTPLANSSTLAPSGRSPTLNALINQYSNQ